MIIELIQLFVLSVIIRSIKTIEDITQIGGHKTITAFLIVIETVFFLYVFRAIVLSDLNLFLLVAVAGGYVAGYYLGSIIEDKMALGKLIVTIKISKSHSKHLSKILRDNGFVFIQSKRFYTHKGKLRKIHQGIIYRKELPKLKHITKDLPIIATVEDVKSTFGKKIISSKDYLEANK
ncbi:MAG: hypothetical protein V1900_01105 [Candidatus Aenigmatarchaeota archaeon]